LELQVFARYAYAGAFFWSMSFISIGFYLGKQWFKIRSHLYLISILGLILFLVLSLGYLFMQQRNNRPRNNIL